MNNIHSQKILIIDFGSQYTQLIARRVREAGVYCEIYSYNAHESLIKDFNPNGIILSGGPETTTAEYTPRIPQIVFDLDCPVLGICYGMQAMASQLGGAVQQSTHKEFGHASIQIQNESPLLQQDLNVWMSHGDKVSAIPDGFEIIASSENAPIAAIANIQKHYYGLQFHPEVTHTEHGQHIIESFVKNICQCEGLWTASNIIDDAINSIRQQVGDDHVLLGLSGGVDSSVVAALLHRAIDTQLTCVFVDNGLLRLGEAEQVMQTFARHSLDPLRHSRDPSCHSREGGNPENSRVDSRDPSCHSREGGNPENGCMDSRLRGNDRGDVNVIKVDAQERFLSALKGVTDPEAKRKKAGNLFIEIFEEESKKIPNVKWLAQGTIYPDVIESGNSKTGNAHVIKSHHNVGGLPATMNLELIEPLRELFKDEVRQIGLALGLPHDMVFRHPFPGPGLGIRILGEVKKEYADLLRHADAIFIEELRKQNLYEKVSQAFAVFLPVKSVAVMGDARKYDYVIALRAVETVDFMTAQWAHLSHEFLGHVSNRIMNEVNGVSRVVYDISGKPPATIEWE